MVSCIPIKTWMWRNPVYQLPSILSKGEMWNFQRGKLCSLLMVNAEKWVVKKRSGGDANLLLPNFCVLPALSCHLSVFSKLCIMNTSLHFLLLLCQSCFSLRNVSFGSGILGLTKSGYHGWLSMMTSSEGPPFQVLPRAPPILNPSLFLAFVFSLLSCFHSPRIVSFFPFSSLCMVLSAYRACDRAVYLSSSVE